MASLLVGLPCKYNVKLDTAPMHTVKIGLCPMGVYPMKTIIQLSEAEEAKALPILLRHSPGTVLPNRTYLVSEDAAKKLREAGVQFTELSRESNDSPLERVGSGERI